MRILIRTCAIPSLIALVLSLSTTAAFAQKGSGGGGGGGSGGGSGSGGGARTTNPFIGNWVGGAFTGGQVYYQFTFNKDFTFTLRETNSSTGVVISNFSGTYVLSGVGPDGFPVITMFSGGQILLEEEYSPAFEGMELRGTLFLSMGKL